MSAWRDISSAPKPHDWIKTRGKFLIGRIHQPLTEDGEPYGDPDWSWVQVATLTSTGWHVWSSGFKGVHGAATFPVIDNATHWMPLPEA